MRLVGVYRNCVILCIKSTCCFVLDKKIRNLDRIFYLPKRGCIFSEYSISFPTKRVFYPNWTPPKRRSFFLCKITNITSRICTQRIFAPKIMLMARNRRWIPPGARTCQHKPRLPAAQQLRAPARARTQLAHRPRPARSYQPAHNR